MAARATTTARGYGSAHQRLRKMYARIVAGGEAYCARCGRGIWPDEPFDLDHTPDRTGYLGVSHVRCNRATAKRFRRRRVSRRW